MLSPGAVAWRHGHRLWGSRLYFLLIILYTYSKGPVRVVRILLLSNLYPPYVEGGAEILAGEIGAGLARLGHEVMILTSSYGVEKPQRDDRIWRTLRIAPTAFFD